MLSIKPAFQSTKPDDPEALADGQITPSRWNADLATLMATARILGRTTAGNGPIEELDAATARTLLGIVLGAGAGNVPVLDGAGKLATSVLPALALTDTFEVASQSAMLALDAQQGDIAIRTDLNKTFVLSSSSPSTLADWKELRTPTDVVLSVAGLTGTITAAALRAALNLVVGTDVQASSSLLSQISALNLTDQNGKVLGVSGGALALIAGGGSVNVQTGYVDTTTITTGGTGENASYIDVTISAVSNIAKCSVRFDGGGTTSTPPNIFQTYAKSGATVSFMCTARLTSTTNLRISSPASTTSSNFTTQISGRWTVEEFS